MNEQTQQPKGQAPQAPMPPTRAAAPVAALNGQVISFKGSTLKGTTQSEPTLPVFTWSMLESQLAELATSSSQRGLVETLVSATRKQAPFKPAELVLREVLCIASVLMDETFQPVLASDCGEGEMT